MKLSAAFSLFLFATFSQGFQLSSTPYHGDRNKAVRTRLGLSAASSYFENMWPHHNNNGSSNYNNNNGSSNYSNNNGSSNYSSNGYSSASSAHSYGTHHSQESSNNGETTVIEPELIDRSPERDHSSSNTDTSKQDQFIQSRLARLETAFFQASNNAMFTVNSGNRNHQAQKLDEAMRLLAEANERIASLEANAMECQSAMAQMYGKLDAACRQLFESNERITLLELKEREYATQVSALQDKHKEEWESVDVTWVVNNFDAKLRSPGNVDLWSEVFKVAGYKMRFNLELASTVTDDGAAAAADRNVGIYLFHCGGSNSVPIAIGGSKVAVSGAFFTDRLLTKQFGEDVFIGDVHKGSGWKDFATAKTLLNFLDNGDLTIKAKIRVARPKKCILRCA